MVINRRRIAGRISRSALLVVMLLAAALVMGAVALVMGILTGKWITAIVVALMVGAGFVVLGLALARINDRIGELLAAQRHQTNSVLNRIGSPPAALAPPRPSTGEDPFTKGHQRLKELLAIPPTRAGSDYPRTVQTDSEPIVGVDRPVWVYSRISGGPLNLTHRGSAWKPAGLPPAKSIPVVTIADEFTFQSFAPEFDLHRLHPSNWRATMEQVQPAVFFCESAWTGGTPPQRPWQGKVYKSVRWAEEKRGELLEILAYCRTKGIPTVFWNKEDPVHFADRINDFVSTASLFDFVFTSAEDCVPLYLRDTPVEHADVLPFAVQPKIFNPLGASQRADAAVFAGTWYRQYPKRSAAAEQIMDLVTSTGRELVIFDRMFHTPKNYEYPEKYDTYRRPPIPFEKTADAYRENRFGITLNTITDSRSMFARRVYEMAACGAVVLSNTALGVEHVFGDSVILADRDPGRFLEMTETDYQQLRRGAFEIAFDNTYAHRARTILGAVGLSTLPVDAPPALGMLISSREDYEAAIRLFQDREFSELLCLVEEEAEDGLLFDLARERRPNVTVESFSRVRNGEYRSRSLLSAPYIYFTHSGEVPDRAWITAARRHLSYADAPIMARVASGGVANSHDGFLATAEVASIYDSLMTAEQFDKYICCATGVSAAYLL